jgi:hypothetical protein
MWTRGDRRKRGIKTVETRSESLNLHGNKDIQVQCTYSKKQGYHVDRARKELETILRDMKLPNA